MARKAEEKPESSRDPRADALERAMAQIEKQYGKGTVMRLGAGVPRERVPAIPTGSLSLDVALGVGGIPRGRVIEIFGPEGGGKTTLALQVIANAQKRGGIGAFIDAEHAFDADYAEKLGLKLDDLLVSQPDTGEQALEVTELLVRSNAVDVVVIDSVAALVPRAEIEGEISDQFVGMQARLMSQALRRLSGAISKARAAVIFINQLREKIGVMYGSPETTPGGRALKFYASVRIEVRRVGNIADGDNVIGVRTRAKVVKNKVAAPFRQAEFDLLFGQGISREADLIDLGVKHGVLEKSGTWFSFGQTRLGQGRENAREFLCQNPDVADAIESRLRALLNIPLGDEPTPAAKTGTGATPTDP